MNTKDKLNRELEQNQETQKNLDRQIMCIQGANQRDTNQVVNTANPSPQLSFSDRLKRVQIRQDDKSGSTLENEMFNSEISNLQQSMLN